MTQSRESETITPREADFSRSVLLAFSSQLRPNRIISAESLALSMYEIARSGWSLHHLALFRTGAFEDLRWCGPDRWHTAFRTIVEPVGVRDLLIETTRSGEWVFRPNTTAWAESVPNILAYRWASVGARVAEYLREHRRTDELDVACWGAIGGDNQYRFLSAIPQHAARYASMCGDRGAERVRMRIIGTGRLEDENVERTTPGFHYGWQHAGEERRLPVLVWHNWTLFSVCFDADPVVRAREGDGRIVQMQITKEVPDGNASV